MTAVNNSFTPPNPHFERMVRDAFAKREPIIRLGASLVAVNPGRVEIELPFSAAIAVEQSHFASAAVAAIGETAGACAALTLMPDGSDAMTVDYKVNFIRPARGKLLRASGQAMRAGQFIIVARVEVKTPGNGAESVCAVLQTTMLRVAA
jgi:uncharacterized protein (TIGR00369 family)